MIDLNKSLQNHWSRTPSSQPIEINLKLPSDFPYFDGHFPDYPVLPAVAFLDISRFFIVSHFQHIKGHVNNVSNFRIKATVTPKQIILIRIIESDKNNFKIEWLDNNNQQLATMNLTFAVD